MSLYMSTQGLTFLSTNHTWSNGHKTHFFGTHFATMAFPWILLKQPETPWAFVSCQSRFGKVIPFIDQAAMSGIFVDQWGGAPTSMSDTLSQSFEIRRWCVQEDYPPSVPYLYNLGADGFHHCPVEHFPSWLWLIWVIMPIACVQIGY